ncbi:hypothetical protein RPALISO_233 [Ruegeria phage RpAliso]|nr:hypothetical protein RPALISO_233 [Ruegeria phage RpAliso]
MKSFDGTPVATIINANGVPFTMRLVRKGDGYGRDLSIIHDGDEPKVEFYDARHGCPREVEKGGEYGQFVSRYYLKTLRAGGPLTHGLILDGGVPSWTIDARAMALAMAILDHWTFTSTRTEADLAELAFRSGYACGMDHATDEGFENGCDEAWEDQKPAIL